MDVTPVAGLACLPVAMKLKENMATFCCHLEDGY
jgi:hypothetical protein